MVEDKKRMRMELLIGMLLIVLSRLIRQWVLKVPVRVHSQQDLVNLVQHLQVSQDLPMVA